MKRNNHIRSAYRHPTCSAVIAALETFFVAVSAAVAIAVAFPVVAAIAGLVLECIK